MAIHVVLATLLAATSVLGAPTADCPEPYGVQTYAHPEYCDHFFKCTNGTLTLEQCENGLLYDGKGNVHEHCNYHWAVECGTRKAELVPINAPGCEFAFGIYPNAPCSTTYNKCAFGVPHEAHCEAGLAYDDRTHSCNWPDLLLDVCNPEAVVGFKCPEKVDPKSVSAKFNPYPRFNIGECGRLVTCVNGYPRIVSCGEGKVVNDESLTCDEPEYSARCANYFH
ncbi:protein obstructor-E [Cloeon dipterum]|uniref:Chitin-binding type-2 domain-containing protein n=1 Tax=Cloeon dipterum TaxID=197152 RepID=A0A8S1DCJ0_9INSE|nr:Hypothetical predicted protein [Cloeon dipterum]